MGFTDRPNQSVALFGAHGDPRLINLPRGYGWMSVPPSAAVAVYPLWLLPLEPASAVKRADEPLNLGTMHGAVFVVPLGLHADEIKTESILADHSI